MSSKKKQYHLIGMAGGGKSTIGKLLASELHRPFLDTDDLIVKVRNLPLQDVIDKEGPVGFKILEERVLLDVDVEGHVIATGGSSVYSHHGMDHLRNYGTIILLQVELATLKKRVGDTSGRGLVKQSWQNFEELYEERRPLYEKYAELTVECSSLMPEVVCGQIIRLIKG